MKHSSLQDSRLSFRQAKSDEPHLNANHLNADQLCALLVETSATSFAATTLQWDVLFNETMARKRKACTPCGDAQRDFMKEVRARIDLTPTFFNKNDWKTMSP